MPSKSKKDKTVNTQSASDASKDKDSVQVDESPMEGESDMKQIVAKMGELAKYMSDVKNNVSDIKDDIKSLKALQKEVDDVKKTADEAYDMVENNTSQIDSLKVKLEAGTDLIKVLEVRCDSLQNSIVQQDIYSRRENLLFNNIPENEDEHCLQKLVKVFIENLKMDEDRVKQIQIVRCHHLGRPKAGQVRPIICRFHFFGDQQEIWSNRSNLKGSDIIMKEDFPKEIVTKRNILAHVMFEARRQNHKATMVADKLIIDGRSYFVATLDALPANLNLSTLGTKKVTEDVTAFYGQMCPLSNYYPAPFKDDKGITHHCSEQFMHYYKAELFEDHDTAVKILAAKTPQDCKNLGKQVKHFDIGVWKQQARDIMLPGLLAKFRQNPICLKALQATEKTKLVEASPMDSLWGICISMKSDSIKDPEQWKGSNWMGKLLESVRTELITG